jgi:hypothetical protein
MLLTHVTQLVGTSVAGLFLTPLGISLFGIFGLFAIFGPIILILLVASLFGGRSRSHGDPSGLGIVVGFGVLIILTVAINAAMR